MNTSIGDKLTTAQAKLYTGLDFIKFACAFLIVFMHSFLYDLGAAGEWFRHVITTIGVPFFFITSGFFFKKGLLKNDNSPSYMKRYVWRIVKMYLAWSVITLPVSWLCIEWGHPDYSLPLKIVYLFRMFLFSGSCGIYWYLLALIISSIIIFYFDVKKKQRWLYLFAILLFIVGVIYDSPYKNSNLLFKYIHVVFGSERNFFNVGLFYMCIGHFFASHTIRCNNVVFIFAIFLSIIARTLETQYSNFNFMQAVIALVVFLWASNIDINISDQHSLYYRKLSTAIYLLHFPFLLVIDYNFERGTLTGFFSALAFSIITYHLLNLILSKKNMALLFG